MPKYKLTYFGARGRSENIRLIMAAGKLDFEDNRIEFDQWMQIKPTTPFGSLPLLEVDGGKLVLAESRAIIKYVAKQGGMRGKNDMEEARADMLSEVMIEAFYKLMNAGFPLESDKPKQEEAYEKIRTETLPNVLPKLAKQLKDNNGGKDGGFLVGNSLTYADTVGYHLLFCVENQLGANVLAEYPAMRAFKERIGEIPEIKKWCQERPVTKF